jgi:hypothetical protein
MEAIRRVSFVMLLAQSGKCQGFGDSVSKVRPH